MLSYINFMMVETKFWKRLIAVVKKNIRIYKLKQFSHKCSMKILTVCLRPQHRSPLASSRDGFGCTAYPL